MDFFSLVGLKPVLFTAPHEPNKPVIQHDETSDAKGIATKNNVLNIISVESHAVSSPADKAIEFPKLLVTQPTLKVDTRSFMSMGGGTEAPAVDRSRKPILAKNRLSLADYLSDDAPTALSPETSRLVSALYPEAVESHGIEVVQEAIMFDRRSTSAPRSRDRSASPGFKTAHVSYTPFTVLSFKPYMNIAHRHVVIHENAMILVPKANVYRWELWSAEPHVIIAKFAVNGTIRSWAGTVYTWDFDRKIYNHKLAPCSFNVPEDFSFQVRIPSGSKYSFPTPPLNEDMLDVYVPMP